MNVEERDVGKPFRTVRTRVLETLRRLVGFPSSIYSLGFESQRKRAREIKKKDERHRQTGRQTNRQNEKDTVTFHLQRETKKQRETQTPNRDGGAG